MNTLPLALKLAGQPCLVVGGGDIARRKIEILHSAGARIAVVTRSVSKQVRKFCDGEGIAIAERSFEDDDVVDRILVIAATNAVATNTAVQRACDRHRVLVNCVDDGSRSTALFPALVDRGPVTVAVSTEGTSPTLARRVREQIEAVLPHNIGALATYLGDHRERVKAALPELGARQKFWDRMLDSELADAVGEGDLELAERILSAGLAGTSACGVVSLVGAGPGDPDLLTLKALNRLQRADVIYHDKLVGAAILDRCRRDARRVDVGRRAGDRSDVVARQAYINDRLEADARSGLRVVRLKGGDPLVFGRGGEEIAALLRSRMPFEVVPGITAGLGCAAIAGIPLTHREWAQSVRFVTAQIQGEAEPNWPELAKADQTLVVYMGLDALAQLCARLLKAGAEPQTPAAAISRAGMSGQRIVTGTITTLAKDVQSVALKTPVTTIIGRVAIFANRLPV